MTAAELITHLRMLDVTLAVDGEQLRVNAPKGVLGAELREAIAQAKPELLAWLAAEPRRSEMSEAAPLSFAQQRMWLLDQMQHDSTAYVIRGALRLQGPLDVAVLRRALDSIVRRHAALRTTFCTSAEGEPVQQVHPAAPVPLEEIDLRPAAAAAVEPAARADDTTIEAAARDWGHVPFDLEQGPVFRVALMRCAEHDHLLLTAAHHIVSDGWSSGVFARELCALYAALVRGEGDPLPPLPLQYADHARWQRRTLQGEALQRQLDHWRERLAEPRAVLDLPADRPRPPRQSLAGAECVLTLPDDLPARLRSLAESEQVTTFMLLMAAFQAWLSRTSGQHDILVGTPVAQRDHLAVEGLIGFFANTLVLRSDLSDAPTLRTLLHRVKADLLAAQAHQAVPFEKLVEELNPERDPSRNPLFQAMLMLQRVDDTPVQLPGLVASVPRWNQATSAKFDLTAVFRERQGRLDLVLEYSTDLFDAATAETMAHRLACLLDAGLRNPDAPVDTLPLIDAAETDRLLAQAWGPRVAPSMAIVPERVLQQARAAPERIAVGDEAGTLSYAELMHEARRVATALRALGVRPGDRVAVCTGRSTALVSALLGVWGCAAAYVPLDPEYPPERIAHVLDDAGAAALVAPRALAERLARPGLPVLDLDTTLPAPDDAAWQAPAPQDLAYVIYTSGSTGRPKGVEIEHAALANFIDAMRDAPGLDAHDVVLAITTIAFDIAGLELWLPLSVGARVHVAPAGAGRDPQRLQALLSHTQATLLQATPSTWRLLVESGWPGDAALVALCGGEALPESLAAALVERVGVLWNMYGPTETTIWSAAHRVLPGEAVVLGRPVRNTCFHVLDAHGALLPDGLAGELWIGGLGLARGYHGRPDLSAERFRPDRFEAERAPGSTPAARLYRTGDRVRRRRDGTLVYLGRLDHQVKLRGYRIEPGEIESLLMQQPGVREALVIVREDSPGDQQLVAYLTPAAQALLDPGALKDTLRHSLPDYMVPAAVVVLAALPLTPNGKVDRAGLPAPVGVATQADTTLRSPTEEALAAIWRDVLHVAEVGPADDFFDLGGHSLLATQVASRIRVAFEAEMPLAVLFEARTLEQLAHRVDDAVRHARHAELLPRIPPSRDDGPVRLSFSQERMWMIHQLAPGNLAYNMAVAVRLSGPLDRVALSDALDGLRERHEPLRSVYRLHDGVPVQEVLPWQPETLAATDLAALGDAAMAQALEQAQALARQPFDLAHGPVLRLGLWRVAEQEHLLAIVLHHIAGDHWSFSVIAAEVGQAYAARRSGRPATRPALPIRYRDYARWQRDWLQGEVLERQMAYWRDRLEGLAPLALPFDRPFPDAPTFTGGRHEVALPEGLLPRLEALARREGATLFMTSFAAFVALLHRVNGQDDMALGVPIANRTQSDTEGLVGTFVNTLVMRVGLGGADTFTELLRRVRGVALDAYAHQDMPFEKLVEALVRQRDAQRAPLVQVLFNVQNAPLRTAQIDELLWEPVSLHRGAAQFELSVALSPREGGRLTIEYSAQLFDHDTVDQLIRSYLEVLQAVAADPGATVAALPLLSAGQREQLDAWNRTEAALPPPGLTHLRLQALARSEPDRVAATCGSDRVSLGQLDQRAEALAQHLRALGVASGVLVGVCLPRSLDMLVALLAVQKSGGAYVPLDPGFPEDRLSYMLADSGAPVLLTWGDTAQGVDLPAGLQVVDLQQPLPPAPAGQGGGEPPPAAPAPAPQDPAYVIYTSGSTGKPKGVTVPHGALANFLASMAQAPGLQAGDVLAAVTTISFDIAALELYLPLVVGARVDIVARETAVDGPALAQRLADVGATVLQATPATWRLLIEADWRGPAGFKALCGGEGLPRDLADALLERVGELWNLYGPTETTVWSTTERVAPGKGAVSIGRPIANTQVHVLDRHGQPLPAGMPGELWIGGAGVALGYHRRPELTAERFVPDPFDATGAGRLYRTGDLGRWRHDGRLEHLGRLDHQVKVRGFRIELGEIEVALQAHEQVQQAVVVAREAAPGDLRLVAYVLFQPGGDLTASEVRRHLRRDLPDYMVPSVVVTLDHIPLTPNGKVDRLALPDPFKGAAAVRREHEPPAPGLEQQLAEIWRGILQVERVGAGDNFFELGGHSLLSLRVVAAVERELGWRMDPRTLFFQTLRDVAATGTRALAAQAPGPAGAAST